MYFYAARQPILTRDKELYAYELLFRDGVVNAFPNIDGNEATSRMIEGSQFSFGLDDFLGDKLGFINFTLPTLLKKFPSMLPKEQVVIEILETVQPSKVLLAECVELKNNGYIIALDDYVHKSVWRHFYPYIDIIKIDFRTSSIEQMNEVKQAISDYPHIKLLAEKVETIEEYNTAMEMGFTYFQGYFFAKPEMLKAKALSPAQTTLVELLYETSRPEIDLRKITQVFERDVNLSYKLLRYSNSAIFKRRAEVETIKHALVVLGQAELKKFLSLLFASQINSDKPAELMRMSMTRARFCEELAAIQGRTDTSKAFLTGLMSLMDAILNESIESVMDKLPLASEIKLALTEKKGILAGFIALIKAYEAAHWRNANIIIEKLGLEKDKVPNAYHTAVQWANEQMKALAD
ncbi:EAL and HDOD domain-containing protein [Rheinheimera sp. MMS21-TC3]|uniref:EAL and HDOD domain-containing protein n=1 Tax=Rheinheimera sp. MMS21-TC3 TaxID=3072790 RepID=UPI0028C3EA82|nr:HDOD domain-containing protein [Rheinheimera sp. MMS21-TC3]WNO60712.1 HDOD domain-containing protein [Rheinheimera sp. MMS21-TC3]